MTGVRLVVTGLADDGRSTVVSDAVVDERELPTGRVLNSLWSADAIVAAPGGAVGGGLFPSTGGGRFWLFTVRTGEPDGEQTLHRTETVDLGFVVAGEMTMHLEDDTVVRLASGDAYVQNATMHAWSNRGDVDASVALVVLGVAPG